MTPTPEKRPATNEDVVATLQAVRIAETDLKESKEVLKKARVTVRRARAALRRRKRQSRRAYKSALNGKPCKDC